MEDLPKKELDVYKKYIDVNNEAAEVTDLINSNDIVSLFNVLEHIEEPTKYVEYLYTRMKKGSYLIIEVPKHPSLGSFANLTSMDNIYRHIVPPIHLQIFSIKSLEILLGSKFEIVATWEFGQGFMDVINNAMIISETQPCDLYNMILDKSDSIQKTIDEAGLSDQILIIARKM